MKKVILVSSKKRISEIGRTFKSTIITSNDTKENIAFLKKKLFRSRNRKKKKKRRKRNNENLGKLKAL